MIVLLRLMSVGMKLSMIYLERRVQAVRSSKEALLSFIVGIGEELGRVAAAQQEYVCPNEVVTLDGGEAGQPKAF